MAFDELQPLLLEASTVSDVLKILCRECTIVDISYLEALIQHFNIDDAKEDIQEYQQMIEDKCHKLPLHVCLDQEFKEPFLTQLQRNTIIFILEWEPTERYLKDIKGLLSKAFGKMAKVVKVIKVERDNSIKVVCYAPQEMMTELMTRAKENIDTLEKQGVLSLCMGYYTILDHKSRDKVQN